ncbi:MAG: haloacid dehalogenase type II [Candidatus Thiodiazotropha sp.]
MAITLAFDVYGTLIDTHGVVSELNDLVQDKAEAFSHKWREKQLEYSFRRGLMQNYVTFDVCTSHALDYACEFFNTPLTAGQKQHMLDFYKTLPAFMDARESLSAFSQRGYRLFAFSNGTTRAVEGLLESAGIKAYFTDIISVDDIKSFKPNPAVYSHFLRKSKAHGGQSWLVSSNPFDVIGAISSGMNAAWVRRSGGIIFDPWGIEPNLTVEDLRDLAEQLPKHVNIR